MKIAAVQISVVEGDKGATIEKTVETIRKAGRADLVILPELWNIGFMSFDRYLSEAEDRTGPTLAAMAQVARERKIHLHTGSLVEKEGGRFFNTSFLLSPQGDILATYRKIHLFGYNAREKELLTAGDRVSVVETALGKVGFATCYDLRFPELFRRMVEKGAELFLVCSAWPYPRLEHWSLLNRVRAFENQCFLVSSNAAGTNREARFVGHSMIVDPWGTVLASGGDEEGIVSGEIELKDVASARGGFPALADRQDWLNPPRA